MMMREQTLLHKGPTEVFNSLCLNKSSYSAFFLTVSSSPAEILLFSPASFSHIGSSTSVLRSECEADFHVGAVNYRKLPSTSALSDAFKVTF